ncbi:nucleotide sugar dehydrogenase [Belnapia sp. T6]|uniref:Nucleotide sugar dehydrogenase n=1 Tax=Belnapia mucosa TaxID=2804532 RepID=A0ABS1VAW7_9PROT|nr:nucleotide sugar dehydrogenase [Belnapia mucosa]MBL6458803.1 nucleotide sugar dehydrogenase [Belnapia mucosa]
MDLGTCDDSGLETGSDAFLALRIRIETHIATIGIIGLGYVGLPLAQAIVERGYPVLGLDVDTTKVETLNRGETYIRHITAETVAAMGATGRFSATVDFDRLAECDLILICVPTPLNRYREPDLSYVEETTRAIAARLRRGQLIVLESTTYPGTTAQLMAPILEAGGLRSGSDFFLAYSPEREDPGNPQYSTAAIPKVVGGEGPEALELARLFYASIVAQAIPVSSSATAEAVKLTENIFRAVNIALVNELKVIYDAMGIDVWEVIDAAKTKPFGFMPFYPGPGLGGHCIPIDPFYLTWKAREFEINTRFIELAGEVNTRMPHWVVERLALALDQRLGRGLSRARVLLLGMAYKKNVGDLRESPSLRLMEMMEGRGAHVDYHDPYIPEVMRTREHPSLAGRRSIAWNLASIAEYDAVLIATDHDGLDYEGMVGAAKLVVDTRNVCARHGVSGANVVKA